MAQVQAQPSMARLECIKSVDEVLGLESPSKPQIPKRRISRFYEHLDEDPVLDVDLAFAAPENASFMLDRRRVCEPTTVDDENDEWIGQDFDDVKSKPKKKSSFLPYGLSKLGRRARDSITGLGFSRKQAGIASSDVLLGVGGESPEDLASGGTNSRNSLCRFDGMSMLESMHSYVEMLQDTLEDEYSTTAVDGGSLANASSSYYLGDRNKLAAKIKQVVDTSFADGAFDDALRKLRFQMADGNNTTEIEQWAASAAHINGIVAERAAADEDWEQGQIYCAYPEGYSPGSEQEEETELDSEAWTSLL